MAASLRWILQLHKDVPKAAKFYSEGLDLTINVCTLRWAELESGPLKLALMQSPSNHIVQKGYSSLLSFTVSDINNTVSKLLAQGGELDGPIKYEIHGKICGSETKFVSSFPAFSGLRVLLTSDSYGIWSLADQTHHSKHQKEDTRSINDARGGRYGRGYSM